MNPELQALAKTCKDAEASLEAADAAYNEACVRLINENLPENVVELIEQGAEVPFTLDELVMPRVWDCDTSPISHCVYNPASDPGDLDSCLYCGEPYERK
jgi:hypothetical protein